MYPSQIKKLQPSAINALTDKHLSRMDWPQIGAFSGKQLQAIAPQAMAGLSPKLLRDLVDYRGEPSFTDDQMNSLSDQQLKALGA